MKKTGRRLYLSGEARADQAEKTLVDGGGTITHFFKNILVDERRGYAYKVTFASIYPNVTNPVRMLGQSYGLYSFSTRELRRMSDDVANANLGITRSLAALNRNIGIVGTPVTDTGEPFNEAGTVDYQNGYVIKGDAMVTQSLSIGASTGTKTNATVVTYYIELEEYDVSSDEEILLILNERSQDAEGVQ
tara:strand:+ start:517 stop:1086 length:570 start_codon:yes stop_codon:yes gene_type:complete